MKRAALALSGLMIVAWFAGVPAALCQNLIEVRGADTKYRYLDWNHTWRNALVLDVFYVGVPGSNELNVGGGYAFTRGHLAITPLAYAVIGREESQRGIKVAVLVAFEHKGWKLLGFVGQYIALSGEVESYQVMDAADLTRTLGPQFELGIESTFFHTGGDWNQQTGPLIKLNDKHGAWAVSYRFGAENELRLGRVVTF